MIGNWLYQLSARDRKSQGIVPIFRVVTQNSGLASEIIDVFTVPEDVIFVPMAWHGSATPGAGITTFYNYWRWGLGSIQQMLFDWRWFNQTPPIAAAQNFSYSSRQDSVFFIPPGALIRNVTQFSAVNAANNASAQMYGYTLPRGNLSLP